MPSAKHSSTCITVAELAQQLGLEFAGNAEQEIYNVSSLPSATAMDLCFLNAKKYLSLLEQSDCGAVIVPIGFEPEFSSKSKLYSANPHLSFVQAIHLLGLVPGQEGNVHPSSIIASTASIGKNVSIGANCVIGERSVLGDGVRLGAGCIIEDDVSIGAQSHLLANVTVCYNTQIGVQVILQPGVVLGGDGFGLVYDDGSWVKIPHLGRVILADRVEVGANTTIDRGALDDTVIEQGVKIDNLIQIGHNVHIGENTAIAAHVAIAGSAIIGKNCKISGAVAIAGHLSIADDVTITGMSVVTKSITTRGTFSSGTPLMENHAWHRSNARYKTLDTMAKTLAGLEQKIDHK